MRKFERVIILINANKLKGKIVERGMTVNDLAGFIGVSPSTLYRKLNGDIVFTVREASQIGRGLDLSIDELNSIFFADYVA